MEKRLAVEEYVARSGRTLRKSKSRLWFNESVKPRILKALFRSLGIYAQGVRNALAPVFHDVDFSFPSLPAAFEGFTILHISDLHIDQMEGLVEALIPLVQPLRPDICVLTGDYRFEIRGSCDAIYPPMRELLSHIHIVDGFFGILGNHDASEIAMTLEAEGVRMLMNESQAINRRDSRIWIFGVDDPYDYRCDDLPKAADGIPANEFKILLAHTPSLYREAAALGTQLYLCGHTHAGQIRVPGIGAIKKNGSFPKRFVQGKWSYGDLQGYTSWGAGCSTLPIRFNCPPEVTQIRLIRAV